MSATFDSNVSITVEVAFDSEPFATSQSFSDISQYVRYFDISRGRSNEMGEFRAGTISFSVSNQDNRFNPSQTTYFYDTANGRSKIQPLKQVKVSATYDGTTYVIFRGFLDSVPVKFLAEGADSIVTFTAIDAFRLFQNQTLQSVGWRLGRAGFSELGQTTKLGYVDTQELSSSRVSRILDSIGFPSTLRDINTGTKQVIQQLITTNV